MIRALGKSVIDRSQTRDTLLDHRIAGRRVSIVVSAVKGHSADRSWMECNSARAGGAVNGLPDTFCMLAAGLTDCERELRHQISSGVMMKLEMLRNAVA